MATPRPNPILRNFRRFPGDQSASISLVLSLALPMLLLVTAGVIDYVSAFRQKSQLQSVVDAAALAAASELSLSNSRTDNVVSVVDAVVANYLSASMQQDSRPKPTVTTSVTKSPLQVRVSADQAYQSLFGAVFTFNVSSLRATAVAQVIGRPNICVLALHTSVNGALSLEQNARVTGDNCGVFSNSTHNTGVKAKNTATLKATTICSAGGVQGSATNFDPPPYLDCPGFDDPLASRPEPWIGTCEDTSPTIVSSSVTLSPGTYCGLQIVGGTDVQLSPGIYVIKDGLFSVKEGSRIAGKGVGIFLTGKNARLEWGRASTISLEAPTAGLMAGLLIFASREGARGNQHIIYSEDAQIMVGTIYIPTGELRIDGSATVGNQSAYTAIVAETIRLYGGPHIVLNTRYNETDVPVPEAIKGAGQPVQLVE